MLQDKPKIISIHAQREPRAAAIMASEVSVADVCVRARSREGLAGLVVPYDAHAGCFGVEPFSTSPSSLKDS